MSTSSFVFRMFSDARRYAALCLLCLSPSWGCGGDAEDGSGGDGDGDGSPETGGSATGGSASGGAATGGSSTGGVATGGSATGGSASGGQPGTGGGGECCLAEATCGPDSVEIESEEACPEGATCFSNSICCSTVWCVMLEEAQCDAYPACTENEVEVLQCPQDVSCVERSLCGSTIYCMERSEDCDPENEPNREYVGSSPAECALIDYVCPEHTTYFGGECGCGCEQPADCPEYVDCSPMIGDPDPTARYCDSEECPYSDRVY